MWDIMDKPILVFVLSLVVLWVSEQIGVLLHRYFGGMGKESREDLGLILGASLTLLGLIIGFSFSMAISRYDQRKNLEEAEANAIGTEFVRADLLPNEDAARVRALLGKYLEQRLFFYRERDSDRLHQIDATTSQIGAELWAAVRSPAETHPDPVRALVLAGMNDILNSQGYTQAAWWNRIPVAAWLLMGAISICCNAMVGFYASHLRSTTPLFLVLPLVLSITFFLIADIDSPRRGIIRVKPQNLSSLGTSMHAN